MGFIQHIFTSGRSPKQQTALPRAPIPPGPFAANVSGPPAAGRAGNETPSPEPTATDASHAGGPWHAGARTALLGDPRRRLVALAALVAGALLLSSLGWSIAHTRAPAGTARSANTMRVTFFDSTIPTPTGASDALAISAPRLADPPSGFSYQAWLVDDAHQRITALGNLVKQHDGIWSLRFKSTGANLLAMGTQVVVTRERNNQPTTTPSSDVALQGKLPPPVFAQVTALLVTVPSTPGQHGLHVGLLGQARLVSEQARLLNTSLQHNDAFSARCTAQGLLDVVEGTRGPNYRPLSQECQSLHINQVSDGFGILGAGSNGYLAGVLTHAALTSHASDATPATKEQAAHLQIAGENAHMVPEGR